jgi:uncharacterized protein DUF5317
VIGWARRGRVSALTDLSVRALPLLGIATLLVLLARAPGMAARAGGVLVGAGYLAALVFLWLNRAHPGVLAILLGAALNAAAILANGGRMPVSGAALSRIAHPLLPGAYLGVDLRHVPAGPGTPLSFLGDVLAVEVGGIGAIVSPGDVLMAVGVAGFVQSAMCRPPGERRANRRT